jgi:hypothetical protein
MTLSDAGVLFVGSASAGTTSGVVFGYNEPGALPTLTVNNGATTGTLPYIGTVYPVKGAVPSGFALISPDDANLSSTVISRWPDNSARVVVLTGERTFGSANSSTTVRVRPGAITGTNLTAADIQSKFSSGIAFNFPGIGTPSITTFTSPDFVWWSNPKTICARYRVAIGAAGLEAVIDVHAFAGGRAFVEVVIENGKVTSSAPTGLTDKTYTGATVAVNGATIATVNSSAAPNATHRNFRAWYCSAWIGGDPGTWVTHDTTYLQAVPFLWKAARAMTSNYTTALAGTKWQGVAQPYASDAYAPWAYGRYLVSNMGGTGEDSRGQIGTLTGWESDYVCSGDKNVAKAVVQSSLCLHTYNVNYRDSSTGICPTSTQMQGRSRNASTWPEISYNSGAEPQAFEAAHQPSGPLIAFLCRPSPCFIELAQKIFVWNHTETTNGQHSWAQGRARGWCMRNYGIALLLTPNAGDAASKFASWYSSGAAALASETGSLTQFQVGWNTLNVMWDYSISDWNSTGADKSGTRPRLQWAPYFQHYTIIGGHMASRMEVLDASQQSAFDAALDWIATYPVRYVNEPTTYGEWRLQNYVTTIGDDITTQISMAATWPATLDGDYTGTPPATTGTWLFIQHDNLPAALAWSAATPSVLATDGAAYPIKFVNALLIAKERGVSGADAAWAKVTAGITNWSAFLDALASDLPMFNRAPR